MTQTLALARLDFSVPDVQQAAKNIIARDASAADYQIFLHICMANRLNPFYGEIYLIANRPYISLKGMLKIAERDYAGVYEGFAPFERWYRDADGTLNQDRRGQLYSVVARVHRKDRRFPMEFEALWTTYSASNNQNWKKYPDLMLTEKAMRGALVFAFPVPGGEDAPEVDERQLEIPAIPAEDMPRFVGPAPAEPLPATEAKPLEAASAPEKDRPMAATVDRILEAEGRPTNFEAAPLRVKVQKLLAEIKQKYMPAQTLDYLAQRAFDDPKFQVQHIATVDDVAALKKAIAYCEDYVGKQAAKGGKQ